MKYPQFDNNLIDKSLSKDHPVLSNISTFSNRWQNYTI